MQKTFIFIATLTLFSLTIFGQDKSNLKSECFTNISQEQKTIDKYKDNLTLKIEVTILKVGKISTAINFTYDEIIQNESSLIQINDSVAIKVAITRAVDFVEKKYLYKVDLFTKSDKCWKRASGANDWNEFYPGIVTAGCSVGYEGTDNYLGFTGTIIIE
jgi:hypothetical protein